MVGQYYEIWEADGAVAVYVCVCVPFCVVWFGAISSCEDDQIGELDLEVAVDVAWNCEDYRAECCWAAWKCG